MIFVDANFFLRALMDSDLPANQARSMVARDLFRRAERGDADLLTSEAVVAEVAFVLTSKKQYALPPSEAASRIETLLRLRNMKLHDKQAMLDALELWARYPNIGFVDALAASYGQQPDVELATFDAHFNRIASVNRWLPPDE